MINAWRCRAVRKGQLGELETTLPYTNFSNIPRRTTGATDHLARYVVTTRYDDIPSEVIRIAKRQVLDTLGAALVGSLQRQGVIVRGMVKSWGGRRQATVWASKLRVPAVSAGLANGAFCHALDFDDYWPTLSIHPSGVLVPAILAAGEVRRASGREFLAALVVGYEVAGKVGLGVARDDRRGWHPTPVIGTIAAAAGVSKLLGLTEEQLRMAIGIAASMAGGISDQGGTMTKPLHSGLAARNGLVAAQLAAQGFTARDNILEGRRGYYEVFFGGCSEVEKAIASCGRPYHLLSPGIGIKMYPSGWRLHHAFEAARAIVEDHDIQPAQVDSVEIGIPREHYFNKPEIRWGLMGKFSLQYHVAMAILDRRLTIESFSDDRALKPEVQRLLARIGVRVDPNIPEAADKVFTPVTISLKDGRIFSCKVEFPRGHWLNQLTPDEVMTKFLSNARRVLAEEKIDRIKQIVDRLEELQDIRQLADALA